MKVLILGARAPVALEWARAFKQCGWTVWTGDSLVFPLTRFSRCVDRHFVLPAPRLHTQAWLQALQALVQNHQVDLVLPTCEEVFYLSHGKDMFPPSCTVMTSDFSLLHTLHHKARFAELTRHWPVCAPQTRLIAHKSALLAVAENASDLVFKPAYSRFASHTLICPSPDQVLALCPDEQHPWVAQTFVQGREMCSFSVLVKGQVTAHGCYHPRYRAGKGAGIWFDPQDPPEILAFVEAFGQATGYTGQVGFDFIQDPQGTFHVLECNPRGTSGVHLFRDSAPALVHALTGSATDCLRADRSPQMVGLAMLVMATPQCALQGTTSLRHLLKDFRRASDVILRKGDAGPFWGQLLSVLELLARAARQGCSPLVAATADIEWDGDAIWPESP